MLYFVQKTHTNIAMLLRDMAEAIKVLKCLKLDCESLMKYRFKMHVYHQLGYCYRIINKHEKAENAFKRMLQIAWFYNDQGYEKEAYHNLAYTYFYLGHIEKSNYYRDRLAKGTIDNKVSINKKVSVQIMQAKIDQRLRARTGKELGQDKALAKLSQ